MNLHLFSSPGEGEDIDFIVEAARPYLSGRPDATVAYLPAASLYNEKWAGLTEKSFRGFARIETIDTERMELPEMEAALRKASLVYIPGGNTFLLSHRLYLSRLATYLSKKVQSGLPLIAYSAGTVLCGPNILTSNDLNMVGTPHLDGLNVTPFNFNVHYTGDPEKDNWLSDYHVFHDNPVIVMADGSYIKVEGRKTQLVYGEAWLLRPGQEKERIKSGALVTL